MAKRNTHHRSIGRVDFSSDYHRSRDGAPLWARCQRRLLYDRVDPDEAYKLEERGLSPCPRCFPANSKGVVE